MHTCFTFAIHSIALLALNGVRGQVGTRRGDINPDVPRSSYPSSANCDCGWSVAIAVLLTAIICLGLTAAAAWYYLKRKKKNVSKVDPEAAERAAYDNPQFEQDNCDVSTESEKASGSKGGYLCPPISSTPKKSTATNTTATLERSKSALEKVMSAFMKGARTVSKRSKDDINLSEPRDVIVPLEGHDFTGLGFSFHGNLKEGLYVRDVMARGPASQSGQVSPGDRIVAVTVLTNHIVFEDAQAILSYASPYPVLLHLKKDLTTPSRSSMSSKGKLQRQSPSIGREFGHPSFRSLSQFDLSNMDNQDMKNILFTKSKNPTKSSNNKPQDQTTHGSNKGTRANDMRKQELRHSERAIDVPGVENKTRKDDDEKIKSTSKSIEVCQVKSNERDVQLIKESVLKSQPHGIINSNENLSSSNENTDGLSPVEDGEKVEHVEVKQNLKTKFGVKVFPDVVLPKPIVPSKEPSAIPMLNDENTGSKETEEKQNILNLGVEKSLTKTKITDDTDLQSDIKYAMKEPVNGNNMKFDKKENFQKNDVKLRDSNDVNINGNQKDKETEKSTIFSKIKIPLMKKLSIDNDEPDNSIKIIETNTQGSDKSISRKNTDEVHVQKKLPNKDHLSSKTSKSEHKIETQSQIAENMECNNKNELISEDSEKSISDADSEEKDAKKSKKTFKLTMPSISIPSFSSKNDSKSEKKKEEIKGENNTGKEKLIRKYSSDLENGRGSDINTTKENNKKETKHNFKIEMPNIHLPSFGINRRASVDIEKNNKSERLEKEKNESKGEKPIKVEIDNKCLKKEKYKSKVHGDDGQNSSKLTSKEQTSHKKDKSENEISVSGFPIDSKTDNILIKETSNLESASKQSRNDKVCENNSVSSDEEHKDELIDTVSNQAVSITKENQQFSVKTPGTNDELIESNIGTCVIKESESNKDNGIDLVMEKDLDSKSSSLIKTECLMIKSSTPLEYNSSANENFKSELNFSVINGNLLESEESITDLKDNNVEINENVNRVSSETKFNTLIDNNMCENITGLKINNHKLTDDDSKEQKTFSIETHGELDQNKQTKEQEATLLDPLMDHHNIIDIQDKTCISSDGNIAEYEGTIPTFEASNIEVHSLNENDKLTISSNSDVDNVSYLEENCIPDELKVRRNAEFTPELTVKACNKLMVLNDNPETENIEEDLAVGINITDSTKEKFEYRLKKTDLKLSSEAISENEIDPKFYENESDEIKTLQLKYKNGDQSPLTESNNISDYLIKEGCSLESTIRNVPLLKSKFDENVFECSSFTESEGNDWESNDHVSNKGNDWKICNENSSISSANVSLLREKFYSKMRADAPDISYNVKTNSKYQLKDSDERSSNESLERSTQSPLSEELDFVIPKLETTSMNNSIIPKSLDLPSIKMGENILKYEPVWKDNIRIPNASYETSKLAEAYNTASKNSESFDADISLETSTETESDLPEADSHIAKHSKTKYSLDVPMPNLDLIKQHFENNKRGEEIVTNEVDVNCKPKASHSNEFDSNSPFRGLRSELKDVKHSTPKTKNLELVYDAESALITAELPEVDYDLDCDIMDGGTPESDLDLKFNKKGATTHISNVSSNLPYERKIQNESEKISFDNNGFTHINGYRDIPYELDNNKYSNHSIKNSRNGDKSYLLQSHVTVVNSDPDIIQSDMISKSPSESFSESTEDIQPIDDIKVTRIIPRPVFLKPKNGAVKEDKNYNNMWGSDSNMKEQYESDGISFYIPMKANQSNKEKSLTDSEELKRKTASLGDLSRIQEINLSSTILERTASLDLKNSTDGESNLHVRRMKLPDSSTTSIDEADESGKPMSPKQIEISSFLKSASQWGTLQEAMNLNVDVQTHNQNKPEILNRTVVPNTNVLKSSTSYEGAPISNIEISGTRGPSVTDVSVISDTWNKAIVKNESEIPCHQLSAIQNETTTININETRAQTNGYPEIPRSDSNIVIIGNEKSDMSGNFEVADFQINTPTNQFQEMESVTFTNLKNGNDSSPNNDSGRYSPNLNIPGEHEDINGITITMVSTDDNKGSDLLVNQNINVVSTVLNQNQPLSLTSKTNYGYSESPYVTVNHEYMTQNGELSSEADVSDDFITPDSTPQKSMTQITLDGKGYTVTEGTKSRTVIISNPKMS